LKISEANVSLAISVVANAGFINMSEASQDMFISMVLSFFSLSLFENALVSGLIIYKILAVYRDIQGSECRIGYANRLIPIISILIESGMITFIAQFVQIFMFKFTGEAYPIIGGPVIMIYVRNLLLSIVDLMVIDSINGLCREFQQQSSLCESRRALPTMSITKQRRHPYVLHSTPNLNIRRTTSP
jgi:hypothetical protein